MVPAQGETPGGSRTSQTAQLQTKRFVLLPQSNLLLLQRATVKPNQTQLVEVSSDDIKEFDNDCTEKSYRDCAGEVQGKVVTLQ